MSTNNTTPSASQVADAAINILIRDITDKVFLIIEEDRKLNRAYLRAVETQGLDAVNLDIGKRVKERLGLRNEGQNEKPKSKHIFSYEEHSLP